MVRRRPPPLALALGLLVASAAMGSSRTAAQTVAEAARHGLCSTMGVEGLSAQLARAQGCLLATPLVEFVPHAGITVTSERVHAYLQASARDALHEAASRTPLSINSAFRTVADQYVLFHSGGCAVVAAPGRSNHQSGRAVDVQNHAAARADLEAAGCEWFGSSDAVHFDCPGEDRRADSVLAFQMLWNRNHPADPIDEDGIYGPMTEARLGRSPAAGFDDGGCDCVPACDGDSVIAADCSRTACAAGERCVDAAPPRCEPRCPPGAPARACASDTEVRVCVEGAATLTPCAAGEVCVEGACLADPCAGVAGRACADPSTLLICEGGRTEERPCAHGCEGLEPDARCGEPPSDAGAPADSGPPDGPGAGPGGCACRAGARGPGAAWILLVLALWPPRRSRVARVSRRMDGAPPVC